MREYDWSKQLPIKPSLPYAIVFWNEDRGERQKQMQKKNVKSDPKIDQTHRNCSSGLSYKQIAQLPPTDLGYLVATHLRQVLLLLYAIPLRADIVVESASPAIGVEFVSFH